MSDDVERQLLSALAEGFAALLVVGPEETAGPLLRRLTGGLGRCHAVVATLDAAGWPEGGQAYLTTIALGPRPDGELTATQALRAALRQDPDYLVVEARELPLDGLCVAGQTGHGVLARAMGAVDEAELVASLASVPYGPQTLKRVVVTGAAGIARVVATDSGLAVWRAGEPLPDRAALTGVTPRVVAPPPPREPVPPLEPDELEALRALLGPHARPTWTPVLGEPLDDEAGEQVAGGSTIGGRPLLGAGEPWPTCGECQAPMPLAVQLARGGLPAEARARFPDGATHFQLFYCTHGGCAVKDPASPDARNKLLRFVAGGAPAAEVPELDEPVVARPITGWEGRHETPAGDDVEELEGELEGARWRLADRLRDGDADDEEATLAGPRHGEKLLGWPAWAQGAEWERCPRCDARMELLFQVDADGAPLSMLFAADGLGHVMQCAAHRDALRFRWACG